MKVTGRAWTVGDHIDTDVLYPGRYLVVFDPEEAKEHVMEGLEPGFCRKIARGDILVAGRSFGCGSAREHVAFALKAAGIGAVIAESVARAFFRNAVNVGLPTVECRGILGSVTEGDHVLLDLEAGILRNLSRDDSLRFDALPPLFLEILRHGGATAWCRRRLESG